MGNANVIITDWQTGRYLPKALRWCFNWLIIGSSLKSRVLSICEVKVQGYVF